MPQRQLPRVAHLEGYGKLALLGQDSEVPNWLCEHRSDKKLVVLEIVQSMGEVQWNTPIFSHFSTCPKAP